MWTSVTDIVGALKGGLSIFTVEPVNYYVVLGIIMTGLRFSKKMIVRK